uniref:PH domain-containing protein n=1 Tax=Angiostrongylus cantonensis TaxID=6313 RepID=A0A0K0DMP2_ANGCA
MAAVKLPESKPNLSEYAAWPQLIGREMGVFTHNQQRKFLLKADGKLMMVDNEPRSLGVVINVDYLVNEKRVLKYSDIKVLDLEKKKPEESKESLPILDLRSNLKVRPWDRNAVDAKFQKMMSISPYRERGIALFSTIWETASYLLEVRKYKDQLYTKRFKSIIHENQTSTVVGNHPGFYIDEISCTEEKYDCNKMAECRGISVKSKSLLELQEEVDPCDEYESEIEIVFIEHEQSVIKLYPGENYRLRIREEVFSTDATRVSFLITKVKD